MSYDLLARRVPPWANVESVFEADDDDERPPTAEERATMERLAAAIHRLDPSARREDDEHWIEFFTADGIEVSLYADEAGISVGYRHEGAAAEAVMERVHQYAALLRAVGYTVYDPQTGETVEGPGARHAYPTAPKRRFWLFGGRD